jgi:hypothetical protein
MGRQAWNGDWSWMEGLSLNGLGGRFVGFYGAFRGILLGGSRLHSFKTLEIAAR